MSADGRRTRTRRAGARRARQPRPPARVARRACRGSAFAIVIIHYGGTVFALALIGLGFVCLHELYRMLRAGAADSARRLRRARPGLILAAAYGDQFQIVLVSQSPCCSRSCWRCRATTAGT